MPANYADHGFSFQYPENWRLEQGANDEATLEVTLASPNTAFWSLSVFPGVRDVRQVADEMLQAMQSEYPALEHDPADHWIEKTPLVGFDLNFYYLDLTNSAQLRAFHHQDATCVILAQAEDREMESAGPIFEAITASLLRD